MPKCKFSFFGINKVEPAVSDQPKCKDLVVAFGKWSLTKIAPQEASSKKRFGHMYFVKDKLLHKISKLRMCRSMLLRKFFVYIIGSTVHTANIEIRECLKWTLTRG